MYLGRHTCLAWLERIPGGMPPYVVAVGDRRRAARVLARLEEPLDLAEHARETVCERAFGRVAVGVGGCGPARVLVVETQMGGPATEIILREVLDESFHPDGPRAVIRVGSCGTLADGGAAPELVIAGFASGWSAAIEQERRGVAGPPLEFDPGRPPRPPKLPCTKAVVDALREAAPGATVAGVFSKDSLYAEQDTGFARLMRELGCAATEMELATIGPVAESKGVAWGGIMATAGLIDGDWYPKEAILTNENQAIEATLTAIRTLAAGTVPG